MIRLLINPVIFGGSGSEALALKVSRLTGIPLGELIVKKFPDGETYVRFVTDVSERDVILVNSMYRNPNDYLIEFLLEVSTLKELGARRIIAFIPYFPYARQDDRFNPGEAVSLYIVAKLIENAGVNEVYTIDMHLHRAESIDKVFKIKAVNLTAVIELMKFVKQHYELKNPLVIGPDEESEQWAKIAANYLGTEYDILEKERVSAEEVVIKVRGLNVSGRDIVIVDDIVSTGGTMAEAVKALKRLGARNVVATCTHPILVGNAYQKILKAGALELIGTDTVPSPVSFVTVAPVIAEALRSVT